MQRIQRQTTIKEDKPKDKMSEIQTKKKKIWKAARDKDMLPIGEHHFK